MGDPSTAPDVEARSPINGSPRSTGATSADASSTASPTKGATTPASTRPPGSNAKNGGRRGNAPAAHFDVQDEVSVAIQGVRSVKAVIVGKEYRPGDYRGSNVKGGWVYTLAAEGLNSVEVLEDQLIEWGNSPRANSEAT